MVMSRGRSWGLILWWVVVSNCSGVDGSNVPMRVRWTQMSLLWRRSWSCAWWHLTCWGLLLTGEAGWVARYAWFGDLSIARGCPILAQLVMIVLEVIHFVTVSMLLLILYELVITWWVSSAIELLLVPHLLLLTWDVLANVGIWLVVIIFHVVLVLFVQGQPLMLAWVHGWGAWRLNVVACPVHHALISSEAHIGAQNTSVHVLLSRVHLWDLILGSYPTCRFSPLRLWYILTCQLV